VIAFFQPKVLAGKSMLITAGPTFEPIDPVRGITNLSSGKMGFAIARAAAEAGAEVTLVAGPVHLDTPRGVRRIDAKVAEVLRDGETETIRGIRLDSGDILAGALYIDCSGFHRITASTGAVPTIRAGIPLRMLPATGAEYNTTELCLTCVQSARVTAPMIRAPIPTTQ